MNKKSMTRIMMVAFVTVAISLNVSCTKTDNPVVVVEEGNTEVMEINDSGCQEQTLSMTPQYPTIVLTKEGDVISCEFRNYSENCGVDYFDIKSEYLKGKGYPDSLYIDVMPVIRADMDCICPYSIYFTIRNIKTDSFYLQCWWYEGMVSFKDANQLTLECISEIVKIDGSSYRLLKPGTQALLIRMEDKKGEVQVPSTISYEGQDYKITMLEYNTFYGLDEMTKIVLPKSIRKINQSTFKLTNLFSFHCSSLENIEVENGSPLLNSIDGVLFSKDKKVLYSYPVGNKRSSYTVPEGVEKIGIDAFAYSQHLTSIHIPESVTIIDKYAFEECKGLESIYIHGKLERKFENKEMFGAMNSTPTIYVPESEVEYIKTLYNGTVLPLE